MTCSKCETDSKTLIRGMCRSCYDKHRYLTRLPYFRAYYERHKQRIRSRQLIYQRQRPFYFARKRREYAGL